MSDSSSHTATDIAIVGGGLAGGLIALALRAYAPGTRFVLIEAGKALGGNHRWSWFDSDLDDAGKRLLAGVRKASWDKGYDVDFPHYRRTLGTAYRSMASDDFHEAIARTVPEGALMLGRKAASLDAEGVDLDDGARIDARTVIDCRSFTPSRHLRGA